jgi:UDP-N-acetylmuramate--alanine ligase
VIGVFQPHLYSRTRDFYDDFGRAFFNADVLVVTDVYPAREEPIQGITGELIANAAKQYGHKWCIMSLTKRTSPFLMRSNRAI